MFILSDKVHWPEVLGIAINAFFLNSTTICVLWHKDFDIAFDNVGDQKAFVHITPRTLNESFAKDVYNFTKVLSLYDERELPYDDWVLKLAVSINENHCEGFIVFEDHIYKFVEAFFPASRYSRWHSSRNRFLFAYRSDLENEVTNQFNSTLMRKFFNYFANVLVIESDPEAYNSSVFSIKTNKFVGYAKDNPEQLLTINEYNAETHEFSFSEKFRYHEKLGNVQKRGLMCGTFDYRPFVGVNFEFIPDKNEILDLTDSNTSIQVGGFEIEMLRLFCQLRNCSLLMDVATEQEDWGDFYPNSTASGLFGKVFDGKIEMAMAAIYGWDIDYMDEAMYTARSGATCLVPAPTRLPGWDLPIRPFQSKLWFGVFILLFIESVSLLFTRHCEQYVSLEGPENNWQQDAKFGFTVTLKLFVSQGSQYVIRNNPLRVLLLACYLIDLIVTNVYCGGLAAIQTRPTLSPAADSVERLMKFELPWAATSDAWIVSISDKENPKIMKLISRYKIIPLEKLRELAKTADYGFVVERMQFGHFSNIAFLTLEAMEHLKLMVDDIYFQFTRPYIQRCWAFEDQFNAFLLLWHSSGLNAFWEWKSASELLDINLQGRIESSMNIKVSSDPVKMDIVNFAGILSIWIFGIVLSILVFILELVASRYLFKIY